MHYGDNGILRGAEYAVDKYQNKAEQEQNELAKIDDYIQNGRETVTISKEELKQIIDEEIEKASKLNVQRCIDTSRLIATIGNDANFGLNSYSYTATEDCAILGRVGSNNKGCVYISINSIDIGFVRISQGFGYSSVNYYLKKGDTIEFKSGNISSSRNYGYSC